MEEIIYYYPTTAEKMTDKEIISLFVTPPLRYSLANYKQNTIIEGERGTGKTIMLRHTEISMREKFENESPVFPIYVPLNSTNFDKLLSNNTMEIDKKASLSREYFNLFCLKSWVNALDNSKKILCKWEKVQKEIIKYIGFDYKFKKLIECIEQRMNNIEAAFENNQKIESNTRLSRLTCLPEFAEKLVQSLNLNINFLILLDDFYQIPQSIQPFIVCIFNKRSEFLTYKIATIVDAIIQNCYKSGYFQYIHDYELFNANRLCSISNNKDLKQIEGYFEEMANKQLALTHISEQLKGIGIKELLGKSESMDNKINKYIKEKKIEGKKTHIKFYGFENIVALSSGNARVFFNIINEIIKAVISKKEETSNQKREFSVPISKKIQNEKIYFVSKNYFNSINSWHRDQSIIKNKEEDIPISLKLVKFIEALSKILRFRLLETNFSSKATILFSFNNESNLNEDIRDLMREGLRQSCIQRINLRRKRDDGTSKTYGINGILTPSLGLIPYRRWIQTIDENFLNMINFKTKDRKKFVMDINKFVECSIRKMKPTFRLTDTIDKYIENDQNES